MQLKKAFIYFLPLLTGVLLANAQESELSRHIDQKNFDPSALLWYKTPADKWDEALPVGNGRMGAMVFGAVQQERIQLNEDTYWTGGPYSTVVKGGSQSLAEVQRLVFEGKYLEAHNLFGRKLMGYPVEQQKYQSLADLCLFFPKDQKPADYKRWLDLQTGITSVAYTADGITYRRDVFCSAPDQVVVVRLTASKPGSLSFTVNLRGVRNQAHSNYATDYFRMDGSGKDGLALTGKSADYMGVNGKLRFEARLKAVPEGGTMTVRDADLKIEHADAVTLYFFAATNFVDYKDVSADQHARVEAMMGALAGKSYLDIRERHLNDYKNLYDRTVLQLPVTSQSYLPTNTRLQNNSTAPDPSLAALAYHFGRYVLIASSRPGCQAANLQGIWNDEMNPMWDSKYTTNINIQMNYWPVESGNLSECAEPLIHFTKDLTDQGADVARETYGCRGWVFHQNTDLWRVAAPMDGPTWGTFTVGGAWLCTHLWEHYQYSMDKEYLRSVYPVLKGAVLFFMDFLVKQPGGKWLVTNPSSSPENFPDRPGNGTYFDEVTGSKLPGTSICAGSAIDMEILEDLFDEYIQASRILEADTAFAASVALEKQQLAPPRIGKDGALQEWQEDWGQTEKPHRHMSPLYGLYPGNVFSFAKTPTLMEACKNRLVERGDGKAGGWCRAWRMALWARMNDGNTANDLLKKYFRDQTTIQLFDKCPKDIQIDGTMGTTAAITEMLMQSQDGLIHLLPALPDEWKDGAIRGLCTRGAFELNLDWKDGKIKQATILSKAGQPCRIRAGVPVTVTCNGKKIKFKKSGDGLIEFPTVKGSVTVLTRA